MTTTLRKTRGQRVKSDAQASDEILTAEETPAAKPAARSRTKAAKPAAPVEAPMAQLPVPVVTSSGIAGDTPEKRAAEESFRQLDHYVHALMGKAEGGLSPLALSLAWADWASHLAISPGKQAELAWKSARKAQRLAAEVMCQMGGVANEGTPCVEPLKQDRRFAGPEWSKLPFSYWSQSFLLAQQWWSKATTDVPGVEKKHEKLVEFYGRQMLDMFAPSNFLATNPQLIARTIEEGGLTWCAARSISPRIW